VDTANSTADAGEPLEAARGGNDSRLRRLVVAKMVFLALALALASVLANGLPGVADGAAGCIWQGFAHKGSRPSATGVSPTHYAPRMPRSC